MLARFVQELMGAEAQQLCGADFGERSSERVNSRNGYRETGTPRVGSIDLAVPKLRQGSYLRVLPGPNSRAAWSPAV